MKLGIIQLAIFLLLGAIFNIAIAWSCAAWSTNLTERDSDYDFDFTQTHWGEFEEDRILLEDQGWSLPLEENSLDFDRLYVSYSTAFGMSYQDLYRMQLSGCFLFTKNIVDNIRSGWPCLALRGVRLSEDQSYAKSNYTIKWLIETDLQVKKVPMMVNRYLPYRPIWPGFAINTFLYATLLWMLTLAPFQLRRHIRRKRGSCLKCGYDLNHADHDICPECGCVCIDCLK